MGALCDGLSWACFIYIIYLYIWHAWLIFCIDLLKSKIRKQATHTQREMGIDKCEKIRTIYLICPHNDANYEMACGISTIF